MCHNYNSYSFHIHKILSILDVLSIYVNGRILLSKMYIEGALMSKSRNIALIFPISDSFQLIGSHIMNLKAFIFQISVLKMLITFNYHMPSFQYHNSIQKQAPFVCQRQRTNQSLISTSILNSSPLISINSSVKAVWFI